MPKRSSGSVKVFYPELSRDQLVSRLRERMGVLAESLPIRKAMLFGSWAKGRATASSDVDVLIVYADPPRADAYRLVWRCLNIRRLEPHIYTESEATLVKPTLDRMTEESVDLTAKQDVA